MTFAMQERPGEFTSFAFPSGVPAPFNMAAAILGNTEMLSLEEKLKMVPGLLPMLTEGQAFIERQDELSVLEFMDKCAPQPPTEPCMPATDPRMPPTGLHPQASTHRPRPGAPPLHFTVQPS